MKKLAFCVFLIFPLFIILQNISAKDVQAIEEKAVEEKIVDFFKETERFHTYALNHLEKNAASRPVCFVATYGTNLNHFKIRKFFDVNDFSVLSYEQIFLSESSFNAESISFSESDLISVAETLFPSEQISSSESFPGSEPFSLNDESVSSPNPISNTKQISRFVVSLPYYSFYSSDGNSFLRFAFAFPKSESQNLLSANDSIAFLSLSGRLDEYSRVAGIMKKISFFHPKRKLDFTLLSESFAIVLLLALNVVLFALYTYISRRKLIQKENEFKANVLVSAEIAAEKASKKLKEITDRTTGLFTSEYLKSLIQAEIAKFPIFGKPFCVATFIVQDTGNYFVLRQIAGTIEENLNQNIISSYKGSGIFVVFFPERSEEDISIFVDMTEEKIGELNIPVISRINEFHGQENFLDSLNI